MRVRRISSLLLAATLGGLGATTAGAVSASATTAGAVSAGASTLPSGNAKTIAFYRAVLAANKRAKGWRATFTGYTAVDESIGKNTFFDWRYEAGIPKGYSWAVDHVTVAASDGRVSWLSDEMTSKPTCSYGANGGSLCYGGAPYEVVLTSRGLVGHFVLSKAAATLICWSPDHGGAAGYTKVGVNSGFGLYGGHFYPMRRVGAAEIVTSTYPWGTKQHATEVDTIPIATHLPEVIVIHVSASAGNPALAIRATFHWLGATPVEPNTTPSCK